MKHIGWMIVVAVGAFSLGSFGCERQGEGNRGQDDRAVTEAPSPTRPGTTTQGDMPRGDQRADIPRQDMPQQRADMPRQDMPMQPGQPPIQQGQQPPLQGQQRADMPRQDMQQAQGRGGVAVQQISTARCEREQRCGNIGAEENYSSTEECMTEVRRDWAQELSQFECPEGVEQARLTACLEEIRNEECASPFDTLARVTECRAQVICQSA